MIIIGIDAHKRSHTAAAIDATGAAIATTTVAARPEGHRELLAWGRSIGVSRWAVEDCRHLSRHVERDLLHAGEIIARVPPKLMAKTRDSARTYGKSDPIDALAVARAALREPDLPYAHLDGPSRELRLLVDHRENLIAERVRAANRLRWHLIDLDATWDPPAGHLTTIQGCEAIATQLDTFTGPVAQIAHELIETVNSSLQRERQLQRTISRLVTDQAPQLLAITGCGALTAAKIVAETANVHRFPNRDAYASHTGTAPLPASSGNHHRHRLSRVGNRQLNAALHRIAVTQLRCDTDAQDLIQRHLARGKTKTEALRILKRHLSNTTYRALKADV